jgi:hypothetical protein
MNIKHQNNIKAISLFSGGLDSNIAVKLMLKHGINVEAVYFHNPFCDCDSPKSSCRSAEKAAKSFNIRFHKIELAEEYLEIIKNPKHGYGKNINPCIDCRILQFKKAKALMKKFQAAFIFTGEVLNERPMSQRPSVMDMIDKRAEVKSIILRPLSAKLMDKTIPEEKGWVKRENLLDIQGRSRKQQIALAKEHNIQEYPTPSGGCFLTYAGFSDKVKDLIKYSQLDINNVKLLKIGRHFRLGKDTKLITGRDKTENEKILSLGIDRCVFIKPKDIPGPAAVLLGKPEEVCLSTAVSILSFYMHKTEKGEKVIFEWWRDKDKEIKTATAEGKIDKQALKRFRITKDK